MNRNKHDNHIELLHQIAQSEIARLLERDIGMNWEQRYDMWLPEINGPAEPIILPEEGLAELIFDAPEIIPERRWIGPSLDL